MHWDAIAAIAQAAAALFAVFGVFQLLELKRSSQLSGFIAVLEILQDERVRRARQLVLKVAGKPYPFWTTEERDGAELACRKFNAVGIMVANKMVNPNLLLQDWSRTIADTWEGAQPMIKAYRQERGSDTWRKFEHLYDLAQKHRRKVGETGSFLEKIPDPQALQVEGKQAPQQQPLRR